MIPRCELQKSLASVDCREGFHGTRIGRVCSADPVTGATVATPEKEGKERALAGALPNGDVLSCFLEGIGVSDNGPVVFASVHRYQILLISFLYAASQINSSSYIRRSLNFQCREEQFCVFDFLSGRWMSK